MTNPDLTRAARLFRAFREATPRRVAVHHIKLPRAVARMGPASFIGYETTHGGKAALYVHFWAPGSKPILYANTGRGELYMIRGRFRVTGRGITDLDARGRIVDYRPPYKIVQLNPKTPRKRRRT